MNFPSLIGLCLSITLVNGQCWQSSYGRGAGEPLSACPSGYEKDGALCYKSCKSNYKGVGPVCWEKCKSGYTDTGALCMRNADTKDKGCCCLKFFGHKTCCNKCSSPYKDTGCTCFRSADTYAKDSYGRGAGKSLICEDGLDQDGALCYPQCKNGFHGIGPVCWSDGCRGAYEHSCGALCTLDSDQCSDLIGNIATSVINGAMDIISAVATLGTDIAALISAYSDVSSIGAALLNDVCSNPNKLQTQCIRKSSDGNLQSCNSSGINPVACGFFCTSTKMVCAKTIIDLSSQITGVLGLAGGAVPNKRAEEAEKAITSNGLKSILNAIKTTQAATLDYSAFQTFVSIMYGQFASSYC